ncbi:TetR/AcrR family transcriptional regulator C-terminal domain-containing protein [Kitasatospora sp. NPDC059811]|uniref:TetR/AcrR family transcriptional regulator C-terminal domain-containing protein n=1 Tax=Streptomycetaceae TaxID=2062 RepID=UPI0007AFAA42|nr:TetR/AcrR family transcriptional regulator C-terminal domain-containing protein [Streptomyces sp. MJM8645]
MLAPCPTGGIRWAASPRRVTPGVEGQVRPTGPYLERTFATGRFPALATVVRDGPHLDADQTFRTGLDFLLDGIEARISS